MNQRNDNEDEDGQDISKSTDRLNELYEERVEKALSTHDLLSTADQANMDQPISDKPQNATHHQILEITPHREEPPKNISVDTSAPTLSNTPPPIKKRLVLVRLIQIIISATYLGFISAAPGVITSVYASHYSVVFNQTGAAFMLAEATCLLVTGAVRKRFLRSFDYPHFETFVDIFIISWQVLGFLLFVVIPLCQGSDEIVPTCSGVFAAIRAIQWFGILSWLFSLGFNLERWRIEKG